MTKQMRTYNGPILVFQIEPFSLPFLFSYLLKQRVPYASIVYRKIWKLEAKNIKRPYGTLEFHWDAYFTLFALFFWGCSQIQMKRDIAYMVTAIFECIYNTTARGGSIWRQADAVYNDAEKLMWRQPPLECCYNTIACGWCILCTYNNCFAIF